MDPFSILYPTEMENGSIDFLVDPFLSNGDGGYRQYQAERIVK